MIYRKAGTPTLRVVTQSLMTNSLTSDTALRAPSLNIKSHVMSHVMSHVTSRVTSHITSAAKRKGFGR